jgi:hypothetical protein
MSAKWRDDRAPPFSEIRGILSRQPRCSCEETPGKIGGKPVVAARFVKHAEDGNSIAAFTGGFIVEGDGQKFSARTAVKWCETLGVDPSLLGIIETD